MKLEITGRHIEVTPALRMFIDQHLRKIPRVLGDNVAMHVILSVEKRRHVCEVVLKSKTAQLTCLATTADMYMSVVRATHNLGQRVLKVKKRRVEVKRRRREAPEHAQKVAVAASPRLVTSVIEERMSAKPMAIEEALLSLGESGDGFVVYRDVESDGVRVVYRRRDGNIGLIRA